MRSAVILGLFLVACTSRGPGQAVSTLVRLPPNDDRTLFAVINLADSVAPEDRYGRLGNVPRLGGPMLEVVAVEPYVISFKPSAFNGVTGPELVYAGGPSVLRDGLDALHLPPAEAVFTVEAGELVPADAPESMRDLRVPCDGSRAATRPNVEEDPVPRCAVEDAAVVITCAKLAASPTLRHLQSGGRELPVTMTQEGCRVDFVCRDEQDCAPGFPLRAILPPRAVGSGDAALVELFSVVDPSLRCGRTETDPPTFACPDSTWTLLP